MRKLIVSILICLSGFGLNGQNIFSTDKGVIKFSSDAPLELIHAHSEKLSGIVDLSHKTFAFVVNINSFNGFNVELQKEHFNENYLESEKYPRAAFQGKIIENVDFTRELTDTIRAKGILIIHGVEQERIIKSIINIKNNVISIKSNFSVLLSDHGIKVPKVVHEKIASEIQVEVHATLFRK